MLCKASLAEGHALKPQVLHSDNGRPMTAATMLATLQNLVIAPSISRPGVTDGNAQAEALLSHSQISSGLSAQGFCSLETARDCPPRQAHGEYGFELSTEVALVPRQSNQIQNVAALET